MRDAPLTTIQGGINRLRTKGGARADTLYDLVNGYRLDTGEVQARPGTKRHAQLDQATRGLVSFGGSLHTFCHKAVFVPAGYTLNILVPPPPVSSGSFTLIGGDITYGGDTPGRDIGADPLGNVSGHVIGRLLNSTLLDLVVVAAYGHRDGASPPAESEQLVLALASASGGPAPADAFDTISFTDQTGSPRTFSRSEAIAPDGVASADVRTWTWTVSPAAVLFAADVSTDLTLAGAGGTTVLPELERIRFAEPFMGALYVAAEFTDGQVHHFWLQQGEQWQPNKTYRAGDIVYPSAPTGFVYKATRLGSANPAWAPNVLRYDGSGPEPQSVVEPTVYNDYLYRCVSTTGASPQSGATEPDWPTQDGATVIESTDSPPDVNIPTTVEPATTTVPTSVSDRYGIFKKGKVRL